MILDGLTMDPCKFAERNAQTVGRLKLGMQMLGVCWRANLLPVLADYAVHQAMFTYDCLCYIQAQRKKHKLSAESEQLHLGSILLFFLKRSTRSSMGEILRLTISSVWGSIGSMMLPGWGTYIGCGIGDVMGLLIGECIGISLE
jgi:hypothetical protein